jgi:hypothetical protein
MHVGRAGGLAIGVFAVVAAAVTAELVLASGSDDPAGSVAPPEGLTRRQWSGLVGSLYDPDMGTPDAASVRTAYLAVHDADRRIPAAGIEQLFEHTSAGAGVAGNFGAQLAVIRSAEPAMSVRDELAVLNADSPHPGDDVRAIHAADPGLDPAGVARVAVYSGGVFTGGDVPGNDIPGPAPNATVREYVELRTALPGLSADQSLALLKVDMNGFYGHVRDGAAAAIACVRAETARTPHAGMDAVIARVGHQHPAPS